MRAGHIKHPAAQTRAEGITSVFALHVPTAPASNNSHFHQKPTGKFATRGPNVTEFVSVAHLAQAAGLLLPSGAAPIQRSFLKQQAAQGSPLLQLSGLATTSNKTTWPSAHPARLPGCYKEDLCIFIFNPLFYLPAKSSLRCPMQAKMQLGRSSAPHCPSAPRAG